jgi:hypothetical protein
MAVPLNSFDRCNYDTSVSDRCIHEGFNLFLRKQQAYFSLHGNSPHAAAALFISLGASGNTAPAAVRVHQRGLA